MLTGLSATSEAKCLLNVICRLFQSYCSTHYGDQFYGHYTIERSNAFLRDLEQRCQAYVKRQFDAYGAFGEIINMSHIISNW